MELCDIPPLFHVKVLTSDGKRPQWVEVSMYDSFQAEVPVNDPNKKKITHDFSVLAGCSTPQDVLKEAYYRNYDNLPSGVIGDEILVEIDEGQQSHEVVKKALLNARNFAYGL